MSTVQETANVEKATESQKGLASTQFGRLFKSTASVVIDIQGNFDLLKAISKGDIPGAITHLTALMEKRAKEREEYKAKHPSASAPVPSA